MNQISELEETELDKLVEGLFSSTPSLSNIVPSYEAISTGGENIYLAGKGNYLTREQELEMEAKSDFAEHLYLESLNIIEEFENTIYNVEDYSEYVEASEVIIEYKEVYLSHENNLIKELSGKLTTLTKKLEDISNATEISQKKMITVKELAMEYAIEEGQQKQLRGRIKNPLPFYQDSSGGKIRYKVKDIEAWFYNQKVKQGI